MGWIHQLIHQTIHVHLDSPPSLVVFFCVYKFHAPKKLCKEDHPSPRWNKRHFTVREFEPMFGPEASGADSKAESINFFPWEASSGSEVPAKNNKKRHKNWCLRRKGSLPEKFQGYLENLKMQGFFGYFGWVGFPLHTPCSLQKAKKRWGFLHSRYLKCLVINHLNYKKQIGVTQTLSSIITRHFRYLKWRNPHLYKLHGYGLYKGKPIPKIALEGSVPPF